MHTIVLLVLGLHTLPGVFWAGSTFAFARIGMTPGKLVPPQLGAGAVTVACGVGLWFLFHKGGAHDSGDHVLAAGALGAVAAASLQALLVLPAARALAGATPAEVIRLQARMTTGQRLAAPFLMIAVVCMVIAHYV